jgi:hypothetical protein
MAAESERAGRGPQRAGHDEDGWKRPDQPMDADFLDYLQRVVHLAPTADQDNHYFTWGTATDARTAVITDALTKPKIRLERGLHLDPAGVVRAGGAVPAAVPAASALVGVAQLGDLPCLAGLPQRAADQGGHRVYGAEAQRGQRQNGAEASVASERLIYGRA